MIRSTDYIEKAQTTDNDKVLTNKTAFFYVDL